MCDEAYPNHLLPGWEHTSIAFHTDEGSLFNCSDDAQPLEQPCVNGDILKCSVIQTSDEMNSVTIEFCRNGERIAQVPAAVPPGGFYGVVGMMSGGEKIQMSPPVVIKRTDFDQIWEVCTPHVVTHHGGGLCSYSGPGDCGEESIGTVRTKVPINPLGPLNSRCFEIQIVNPGEHNYIALGVVNETYPTNLLPGWEESSVGYHADNGNLFHSCGDGQPTGHPCKEGDIMKCTVKPVDKSPKQIFVLFHRNGQLVDQVTTWVPERGFYACFGMMSRREKVKVILPEVSVPYTPPKLQFDDIWEVSSPDLQHRGKGVCYYVGAGGSEQVGTIRSKSPMSAFGPNSSFEVKIVNPGEHCYIALGLCSKLYPTNLLPGWEDISLGFHADNGLILQSSAGEQQTNHPCQRGDVIRCTLEPVDGSEKQVSVVFHKNGTFVGKAILWSPKDGGFYAQVGCMSVGEVIQVAAPQMEPSFLKPENVLMPQGRAAVTPTGQPARKKQPSQDFVPKEGDSIVPPSYPPHTDGDVKYMERVFEGRPGSVGMTTQGGVRALDTRDHLPVYPVGYHHPHMYMRFPHPPLDLSHHFHPPPFDPFHHHHHHHHPFEYMSPADLSRYFPHRYHPYVTPTSHPDAASAASPFTHRQHSTPYSHHTPPFSSPTSGATATPSSTSATPQSYHGPRMYATQASIASIASEQDAPHFESPGRVESSKSYSRSTSLQSSTSSLASSFGSSRTPTKPPFLYSFDSQTSVTDSLGTPEMSTLEENTESMEAELTAPDMLSAGKGAEYRASSPFRPAVKEEFQVGQTRVRQDVDCPDSPSLPRRASKIRPIDTSMSPPPSFPVAVETSPVGLIPKEESRMYRILHHVDSNDDGSLECSLPADSSENSFIMGRLPLTEKMPYFEVEIQHLVHPSGIVAIGLVWNRYPPSQLPGILHGSIAFHSPDGAIYTSLVESKVVSPACVIGDIIGCKASLQYKSEVVTPESKGMIQVEFFRNGCSVGVENTPLPPSGLYPAIGLKGLGTKVKVKQDITLTPNSYFQTHPLPENFSNFSLPPAITENWNCLQNAKIEEENRVSSLQSGVGKPTVIQTCLPFSKVSRYFEVEMLQPLCSYSVLALGVLPKVSSKTKQVIPGEAKQSAGYLPLLGFVMRNGTICCTIPNTVTSTYTCNEALEKFAVGVGIEFHATSDNSVKVFFTVNSQQVTSINTTLPDDGFYPTLAVDSDSRSREIQLASLHFPKPWPVINGLPFGFVRGRESGLVLTDPMTVVGTQLGPNDRTVRAIQAAFPLSPSHTYFEVRIVARDPSLCVSCGVASYNYPLDIHPGSGKESIAFHAHEGRVYHNSIGEDVSPISHYRGATLGCGARFPEDGNKRYAEIFFTVNQRIVARKFVSVPQLGFFPTVGLKTTGGMITIDLNAPDPFPELCYCTVWGKCRDTKVEGCEMCPVPNSHASKIQLAKPVSTDKLVYFKITPISEKSGDILTGLSTKVMCALNQTLEGFKSNLFNIITGAVVIRGDYFQSKDTCVIENGYEFGCGLKPIPNSKKSLLFFTTNSEVVYCSEIDIRGEDMYPSVFMVESTTKVSIDACAIWPPMTPIGQGWAKYANVMQENARIVHTPTKLKTKIPVGFAQAAMPLVPSNPYFEVEVCSSAVDKAIAIGLVSKNYPTNTWIGWKSDSIAYHLDDGRLFKGNGYCGQKFGPKVLAGHTVGCGIQFGSMNHSNALKTTEKLEVFFTLNGAIIGAVKVSIPCGGFFPAICLESPTESVIFHSRSEFPPRCMSSEWQSSFSLHQAGRMIVHSCRHRELNYGVPPKAFCQATKPFSVERPYFEIEIVGLADLSQIQAGAAVNIPHGCTSPNVDCLLYSCTGQLVTSKGTQKGLTGTQTCGLGDHLGCAILFTDGKPSAVEFYLNNMKLFHLGILGRLQQHILYPTIVLTHPGDAVIPTLCLPMPEWNRSSLIGWLRSERVKLRGNIVEYTGSGAKVNDVGVAQVSQSLQLNSNSYYEIEILDPGAKCTIAIGIASADYPLTSQPGWQKNSVAHHGDDGQLFQANGFGSSFGPPWNPYDVIGLGIRSASGSTSCDPGTEVQVYFTRNGEELGHVTTVIPTSGFFPTVGLHSSHEKIKINLASSNLCNQEPARLAWRVLCGLKLSPSLVRDKSFILEYQDSDRKTPATGVKIGLGVSHHPFSENMQYFEVQILSFGHMKAIAIGAVPKSFPMEHAPGWSENSIGYHSDNGELYHASGRGKVFGPVPRKGDTMGCGVSLIPNNNKNCSVFFTYNGMEVGRVRAAIPEGGFYPAIAPTSKRDKISVTFMETFKPKITLSERHFVGLMRINNCSYSDQVVHLSSGFSQAPAMAQFAVALHRDYNHFAVNIIKCEDILMIGLAVRDYPMKYAPGFTSVSIAYDVTKGNIRAVYSSDNFHNLDAPKCGVGDTIGCGIIISANSKTDDGYVFFTKNGTIVSKVQLVETFEELYPIIRIVPKRRSSALFMDWNTPVYEPKNPL